MNWKNILKPNWKFLMLILGILIVIFHYCPTKNDVLTILILGLMIIIGCWLIIVELGFKTTKRKKKELGMLLATAIAVIVIVMFVLTFFVSFGPPPRERMRNVERKSNLNYIYYEIEFYHDDNDYYPTSLSELEKFVESKSTEDRKKKLPKDPKTGEDYLYAHHPAEKPTSYHLGVILEIKDDTDLNNDSDFNSKTAGYVNGFDGGGQVFDIHVEN